MARPEKITEVTATRYFERVTPLWVPPGAPPIDVRYHDAIAALAEWAGSTWVDNQKAAFFPIREILVKSCDSWAIHDWQSDIDWIEERGSDAKHLSELNRAFERFASALEKAPFRFRKSLLGHKLLSELSPNSTVRLSNSELTAAVDRSIGWFSENLKIKDKANSRYGCIEYAGIPKQLPRKEVAIALSLADRITYMRRDGLAEGNLECPHEPRISKKLPWKAIALFASANCANANSSLATSDVQTLVTSLLRKVVLVHWM